MKALILTALATVSISAFAGAAHAYTPGIIVYCPSSGTSYNESTYTFLNGATISRDAEGNKIELQKTKLGNVFMVIVNDDAANPKRCYYEAQLGGNQ